MIWNRVQHKYTLKNKQRSIKTVFKHVINKKINVITFFQEYSGDFLGLSDKNDVIYF